MISRTESRISAGLIRYNVRVHAALVLPFRCSREDEPSGERNVSRLTRRCRARGRGEYLPGADNSFDDKVEVVFCRTRMLMTSSASGTASGTGKKADGRSRPRLPASLNRNVVPASLRGDHV